MRLKDIQHPLRCSNVEKNIYRLINCQASEHSINSIYCGRIQYTYNKMIYLETGKEVHSQEELISEINKWAASLEYPADAYDFDPIITEKYRITHKINHILYHILGCKYSHEGEPHFTLKLNSMVKNCTLRLQYKIEDTDSECLITFYVSNLTDGMFYKIKGDFDTVERKLKSTLNTISLCGLAEIFKMVNITNVNSLDLNDIECLKPSNKNMLGFESVDLKERIINKLEECLKQLKNE